MNYFLSKVVKLTPREEECLVMAGHGYTDLKIAKELDIKPCTVRKHLLHARRKLDANDTTHAVALWLSSFNLLLIQSFIN